MTKDENPQRDLVPPTSGLPVRYMKSSEVACIPCINYYVFLDLPVRDPSSTSTVPSVNRGYHLKIDLVLLFSINCSNSRLALNPHQTLLLAPPMHLLNHPPVTNGATMIALRKEQPPLLKSSNRNRVRSLRRSSNC